MVPILVVVTRVTHLLLPGSFGVLSLVSLFALTMRREAIQRSPLFPPPSSGSSSSRRTATRSAVESYVRRYANRTIVVLQALVKGYFGDEVLGWPDGTDSIWDRSGNVGKAMSHRMRDAWVRLGKPPAELVLDPDAAITRLLGHEPSPIDEGDVEQLLLSRGRLPARGVVWPLRVPFLSLPDGKKIPVGAASQSEEVAWAFAGEARMLRPDWEEQLKKSDIRIYNDPALRGRRVMMSMCVRL